MRPGAKLNFSKTQLRMGNKSLILFAIACVLVTASCQDDSNGALGEEDNIGEQEQTAKMLRTNMKALDSDIKSLIRTKCSSDGCACSAIGYGEKPCGGYWEYLIFAKCNTDENALVAKVNAYNELNKQLNAIEQDFSDCSLVEVPNPDCKAGACM